MSLRSRQRILNTVKSLVFPVATLGMSNQAFAQICRPVSERTGEVGCWIIDR